MGNFAVSLKRLVEKVSLEVIYTPCDLDKISVEIAEVNRPQMQALAQNQKRFLKELLFLLSVSIII